jgi:signal transduction histidine kinase
MTDTDKDVFRLPTPVFLVAICCILIGVATALAVDWSVEDWFSVAVDAANLVVILAVILARAAGGIGPNGLIGWSGVTCCVNLLCEVGQNCILPGLSPDIAVLIFSCVSMAFMGGLSLVVDRRFAIGFAIGSVTAIGAVWIWRPDPFLAYWSPLMLVANLGCAIVFFAFRRRLENLVSETRLAQQRLVTQEKLAFIGTMSTGIAHEIRNPLNLLTNFAQSSEELLEELGGILKPHLGALSENERSAVDWLYRNLSANLRDMQDCGRRGDAVVQSMMRHGTDEKPVYGEASLVAAADRAFKLAWQNCLAHDPGLQCQTRFEPVAGDIRATVSDDDICRGVANICTNAIQAAAARHAATRNRFIPEVTVTVDLQGTMCRIVVADNGLGIEPAVQKHIFEPFHARLGSGKGIGLGLYLSHAIFVVEHEGSLEVDSRPGEGTRVTIGIPGAWRVNENTGS